MHMCTYVYIHIYTQTHTLFFLLLVLWVELKLPKFISWGPKPQHLWIWPYLEIGSLQFCHHIQMRSIGRTWFQYDWCPSIKGKPGCRDMCLGTRRIPCEDWNSVATSPGISRSLGTDLRQSFSSTYREHSLLSPWGGFVGQRNWETIPWFCLSHTACSLLRNRTTKLIHLVSLNNRPFMAKILIWNCRVFMCVELKYMTKKSTKMRVQMKICFSSVLKCFSKHTK